MNSSTIINNTFYLWVIFSKISFKPMIPKILKKAKPVTE